MLRKIFSPVVFIILLATVVCFVWFKDGLLMGSAESAIPFYDLNNNSNQANWAWSWPTLGYPSSITMASGPTYYILAVLQSLGIPGVFLEAAVFWIILVTAGLSIYYLAKLLLPSVNRWQILIAVIFYWVNPLAVVNVWNRFLYSNMFFMALLPLELLLFLYGLKKRRYAYVVFIGLAAVIFSYALTSIPFNILIWLSFLVTAGFFAVTTKIKSEKVFILKYLILAGIFYLLVNFWWIGQLITVVSSSYYVSALSNFHSLSDSLYELSILSQKLGNQIDLLRFIHRPFYTTGLDWAKVFLWPGLNLILFFPVALIFYVIARNYHKKEILYLSVIFILSIFLMKGDSYPLGEVFKFVYSHFVFMRVFRNPFEKFSFIMPISASLLFVYGLSQLRFNSWRKLLIFSAALFILGFWGYPFWSGLIFTRGASGSSSDSISLKVSVPGYYKTINNWLNDQPGLFRFVSLPLGGEGMSYIWDYPYAGVELSSSLISRAGVSHNTTIPLYSDLVTEITKRQVDSSVVNFLPFINTKYLVLRSDIDYLDRQLTNPEVEKRQLDNWTEAGLLSSVMQTGKLNVYEVAKPYQWPKIYITPNVIQTNEIDLAKLSGYMGDFPNNYWATVDQDSSLTDPIVIKPEANYTPRLLSGFRNFSDKDILARLLYVKHLPDSWVYPFVLWKESLETPPPSDYYFVLLYKTQILGKRTAELYKMEQLHYPASAIKSSENRYLNDFHTLKALIEDLYKDASQVPSALSDSLLYQLVLMERIDPTLAAQVNSQLKLLHLLPQVNLPGLIDASYLVYRFKLPKDDNYHFFLNNYHPKEELYIDGQKVNLASDSAQVVIPDLHLKKGDHELAVTIPINDIYQAVASQSSFVVSNGNPAPNYISNLDSQATYQVSFDYKFDRGNAYKLIFKQDIDNTSNYAYQQDIVEDETQVKGSWHHWRFQFTPTVGATGGTLSFVQPGILPCQSAFVFLTKCPALNQDFSVSIRDFQINKYRLPSVEAANVIQAPPQQTPTTWQFAQVNPSTYLLKINKTTDKNELIVFSELFNSNWNTYELKDNKLWDKAKMSVNRSGFGDEYVLGPGYEDYFNPLLKLNKQLDSKQVLTNAYANGWLLDEPGQYNLLIEYSPQQNLYVDRIISVLAIILGIGYLLLGVKWKKSH